MPDPGPKVMKGLLEAFLLESLASGPKHGYALIRELESVFGVPPNRNTMYPTLKRLAETGLVEVLPSSERGREKKTYALTTLGREELDEYRRLPSAFRDALARVWAGHGAPPSPALPAPSDARAAAPSDARAGALVRDAPRLPLTLTVQPGDAGKPYPCPEARVSLSKDARSGEMEIRLTGCPMGAYEYCPQCPVFKSVAGLRSFVFG